ncbi:hypothetical protein BT93_I0123 [Corymbia citriodora subsp. variegata]|nr:hypothetical protein BT93_I0123 [Corymbia citriodora subsp. variegata]
MEEVVIVGAGIAGLSTAVALKKVGVQALVLERSEGLRATGAGLVLYPNAWPALDALGVLDKLAALYAPFDKGYITDVKTKIIREVQFASDDWNGGKLRVVHRKVLLEVLAEELPPNTIRFSSKITSLKTQIEHGSSTCIISLDDGTTIKSKAVIGCDGVHSVVARWLGLRSPVYSGRLAVRGLSVFPEGHRFGGASELTNLWMWEKGPAFFLSMTRRCTGISRSSVLLKVWRREPNQKRYKGK